MTLGDATNNAPTQTATVGMFEVKRLGFGAMRLTGDGIWGEPPDLSLARRVIARAVELGVDFIDTADSYGPDVSERLIGDVLGGSLDVVVATKAGLTRQGPDRWSAVGRPEYLLQQVEMSLRRLRVETLDLWQLHRVDPAVPMEQSLEAVARLQEQGKIRHIGLSEVTIDEIVRARKIVDVVSVQNLYNVATREHDPVLQYCEKEGIVFIPWFPLGGGDLVGNHGPLTTLATRHGVTASQLCLSWLLHRSPSIIAIPGTLSTAHLEANMASAQIRLSPEEVVEIETAIDDAA